MHECARDSLAEVWPVGCGRMPCNMPCNWRELYVSTTHRPPPLPRAPLPPPAAATRRPPLSAATTDACSAPSPTSWQPCASPISCLLRLRARPSARRRWAAGERARPLRRRPAPRRQAETAAAYHAVFSCKICTAVDGGMVRSAFFSFVCWGSKRIVRARTSGERKIAGRRLQTRLGHHALAEVRHVCLRELEAHPPRLRTSAAHHPSDQGPQHGTLAEINPAHGARAAGRETGARRARTR